MKSEAIEVVETATGAVIHEVDVSKKSDSQIERVMLAMLRNLNTERFHLRERKKKP